MFFAIGNVVACEPTGFAEAINALAVHGGRGARAAFMKIINQRGWISVTPINFASDGIKASEDFLVASPFAGAAHGEKTAVGNGHTRKAHADFCTPSDLAEIGFRHCLARNTIVLRPAPVWPIGCVRQAAEDEGKNQMSHERMLPDEKSGEKLRFLANSLWIMCE